MTKYINIPIAFFMTTLLHRKSMVLFHWVLSERNHILKPLWLGHMKCIVIRLALADFSWNCYNLCLLFIAYSFYTDWQRIFLPKFMDIDFTSAAIIGAGVIRVRTAGSLLCNLSSMGTSLTHFPHWKKINASGVIFFNCIKAVG